MLLFLIYIEIGDLADGGYTGVRVATGAAKFWVLWSNIANRAELHTFAVIPKRRGVERSFAWLEPGRRLLWNHGERQLNTSLQMVVLAFLSLPLKRF